MGCFHAQFARLHAKGQLSLIVKEMLVASQKFGSDFRPSQSGQFASVRRNLI